MIGRALLFAAVLERPARKRPRRRKVGGARGYASLNLPGQDVKAGRRLIARPLRYAAVRARLQAGRYDVVTLQESTAEARRSFARSRRWGCWGGEQSNEPSGVGNAVAWRTDRLVLVDTGTIVLPWSGASRDALFLPWVALRPADGGEAFTVLCGHLPYAGYRGATVAVRARMIVRVALFLRTRGEWVAGFDTNSGSAAGSLARRAGGRVAAEHGVDALIASKSLEHLRPRTISRGVLWRFGDHPLVTVRGAWRS